MPAKCTLKILMFSTKHSSERLGKLIILMMSQSPHLPTPQKLLNTVIFIYLQHPNGSPMIFCVCQHFFDHCVCFFWCFLFIGITFLGMNFFFMSLSFFPQFYGNIHPFLIYSIRPPCILETFNTIHIHSLDFVFLVLYFQPYLRYQVFFFLIQKLFIFMLLAYTSFHLWCLGFMSCFRNSFPPHYYKNVNSCKTIV